MAKRQSDYRVALSVGIALNGDLIDFWAYIVDTDNRVIDFRHVEKNLQKAMSEALVDAAHSIRI